MSIVFISLVFLHCMLCLGSDWKMMAESGNVFSPSNPQSEGGKIVFKLLKICFFGFWSILL